MGEVKGKVGFSPKRCKGAGQLCEKATVARKKAPRSAVLRGAYRHGRNRPPSHGDEEGGEEEDGGDGDD